MCVYVCVCVCACACVCVCVQRGRERERAKSLDLIPHGEYEVAGIAEREGNIRELDEEFAVRVLVLVPARLSLC